MFHDVTHDAPTQPNPTIHTTTGFSCLSSTHSIDLPLPPAMENEEWILKAYPQGRAPEASDFEKRPCATPTAGTYVRVH
jgi:hypothetical protein